MLQKYSNNTAGCLSVQENGSRSKQTCLAAYIGFTYPEMGEQVAEAHDTNDMAK